MRVIRSDTPQALAAAAADYLADRLSGNPRSALALPSGNTPLGLYAEIVSRCASGAMSLAEAWIFNLDEYCGLAATDAQSYAAFLRRHLIAPLGLASDRVRLLRGDTADLNAECRYYDAAITACGGIDVCVLGLGSNGHIAFNEPGASWDQRTHVARLAQSTRGAQSSQVGDWQIPTHGITMGIRTLREARHVLLLIAGAHKQAARAALYRGIKDPEWPITSLLEHPSLTVIELCASGPCAPGDPR
jgi:glucosamine-6-phosphate deaminase